MNSIETAKKILTSMSRGALKTVETLDKLAGKLEPLEKAPLIGSSVKDIKDTFSMLNDYSHGRYKKVPVSTVIGAAAIVVYLVLPFDLIPDNIPLLGFIDDAFIINTILDLCLESELKRYREWRTGSDI